MSLLCSLVGHKFEREVYPPKNEDGTPKQELFWCRRCAKTVVVVYVKPPVAIRAAEKEK